MPTTLPVRDVVHGLLTSLATASRFWLQLTLVAIAWLGIVPLTAFRIYKCLFSGSASAIFSLPLDLLSSEHLISDAFYGCCVVTCTLCSFISLVWLREQILRAGPDWLLNHPVLVAGPAAAPADPNVAAAADAVPPAAAGGEDAAVDAAVDGAIDHEHDQLDGNMDPGAAGAAWAEEGAAPQAAAAAAGLDPDRLPDAGELAAAALGPNAGNGGAGAAGNGAGAAGGGGVGGHWDRAADELTWERILGLDGSLVFLEHVLWVICLNTLFILIFAFLPFHIGNQIVSRVDTLKEAASASQV